MEEQGKRRRCLRRVVLVPFPFQGHINPMLQLGSILHSNGFSITVVHAQYNSPDPSSHPGFSFVPLPDTSSGPDFSGEIIASIVQLNTNYKARFQECLAEVMSQQGSDDGIACIIHDELMYFSQAEAKDLKLPSISLTVGSAAHFLARSALVQLKADGHIPFPVEKIQHQWQVPIFTMGPMHRISSTSSSSLLEEDTSCLAWLDKQSCKSVIYVSLGSVAFMDIKELAEMAWGLANSHQPFLWVVRPGSVRGEELIEVLSEEFKKNIGERGYIVKWAPQKKVLAHIAVGGFLSHCGWNSTLESICEGIPMICRPCLVDQKVNARYVSHIWRVGLELEGDLERGEIKRAVKKLLVGEEGEAMREKAKKLKENVELCIKEGGSSYNSMNRLVEMIRSF